MRLKPAFRRLTALCGCLVTFSSQRASALDAVRPYELALRAGYEDPYSRSPVRLTTTIIHANYLETGEADPYSGGPAFTLSGRARPISWLAFGVDLRFRAVVASAVSGYDNLSRQAFAADAYVRWYFTRGDTFDPWLAAAFGYVRDLQNYTGPAGGGFVGTATLTHNGIGTPISAGVDVHAVGPLWVGPYAGLEPTFGLSASQSDTIAGSAVPDFTGSAITYVSWSAGVEFKIALGRK